MPDLKAIDVSERTEKELFIWPLQPPLYIQYKHQAFLEHLPCVLLFQGPLGGGSQISEKQGASNQTRRYVYTRHTL